MVTPSNEHSTTISMFKSACCDRSFVAFAASGAEGPPEVSGGKRRFHQTRSRSDTTTEAVSKQRSTAAMAEGSSLEKSAQRSNSTQMPQPCHRNVRRLRSSGVATPAGMRVLLTVVALIATAATIQGFAFSRGLKGTVKRGTNPGPVSEPWIVQSSWLLSPLPQPLWMSATESCNNEDEEGDGNDNDSDSIVSSLQEQLVYIEALEERNKAQLDSFVDEQDQWESMEDFERELLSSKEDIAKQLEELLSLREQE